MTREDLPNEIATADSSHTLRRTDRQHDNRLNSGLASTRDTATPSLKFDDLLAHILDSGTKWACTEDVLSMAVLVSDLLVNQGVPVVTSDGKPLFEQNDVDIRHLMPHSRPPMTERSKAGSSSNDLLVEAVSSLVSVALSLYRLTRHPRPADGDPRVLWPRYEQQVTTALQLAGRIAIEQHPAENPPER